MFNLITHFPSPGGNGAEVVYALRNEDTLAKKILDELEKSGQVTRKFYQRRLPSDSSKDYYFIHRNTGVTEPVLIEYGFLDNAEDANRLKNNYEDYAEAVVRAVSDYKNIKYVPPVGQNAYTVKKGDSLYSIARNLGVDINVLRELNNLTSDVLQIGQILILPDDEQNNGNSNTYTVQRGDSLYSIAKKFNVPVDELKKANNLANNLISIGQTLVIPTQNTTDEEYSTYTVKAGDRIFIGNNV